jgi:hypothetical protein
VVGVVGVGVVMGGAQVGRGQAEGLAEGAAEDRGAAEAASCRDHADIKMRLGRVGQRVVGARQAPLLDICADAADRLEQPVELGPRHAEPLAQKFRPEIGLGHIRLDEPAHFRHNRFTTISARGC